MAYPQSTAYTAMVKLFLAGTNTPATGKTAAVTISKAGGAFGNPSGGATNATELSGGWYYYTATTTDTNTLGDLVISFTATGCDVADRILPIVSASTGGLTNLDATVSSRLATSGYTAPTTPPTAVQVRQEMDANSTKLANLDATVSSRLATSGYTAPPSIAGLATSTNVTTAQSNVIAALPSVAGLATSANVTAAQNAIIAGVSAPTVAQIAAGLFVDGATNKLKVNGDNTASTAGASTSLISGLTSAGVAAIQAALQTRQINVQSPLVFTADGTVNFTVVAGDDYYNADGRAITPGTLSGSFPDWTNAVATVEFGALTLNAVITTATGNTRALYWEMSSANTTALAALDDKGFGVTFDLIVTLASGHRTTVINQGVMVFLNNV
jgi:hypothetical protein